MIRHLITAGALILASAAPVLAQGPGVRVGVTGDPDQFVLGGHMETAPLIENLTFRPTVHFGIGDDTTLVAFNFDFAYWIPIPDNPWRFYVGGGPAANIVHRDRGANDGETDVLGGFNIVLGVQHAGGLFTELRVGAIDSPNIGFAVGWSFR